MLLTFPDLDTLRLALTTGAVPPPVGQAAAAAGFDADGRVSVQPSVAVPHAAQNDLRKLGVEVAMGNGTPLAESVCCWPQLLPLQRVGQAPALPEQTPVLFDLPAEQLAAVACEILRLGNDRQSYRYLESADGQPPRVLLRVVGPPYYSLLRALDRDADGGPQAFVECAARVWCQVGWSHPLGPHLKPPDGKILLLRPPRQWLLLDDAPFRDIYEVLEFTLPDEKTPWHEGSLGGRLRVPLRLTRGGPAEGAELWVLRDNPVGQLDAFVRDHDNDLLGRLLFAVGEVGGKQVIVVRVRPSRSAPPVLQFDAAVGCRSFLKLPNLFLPVGTRLHPPLRRDVVRKLLADDPETITWLYPGEGGRFTPESLPDAVFRPLRDWVEYVIELERKPLELWVESTTFDFEPFVCDEEQPPKPKKPPQERKRPGAGRSAPREAGDVNFSAETPKPATPVEIEEEFVPTVKAEPSKLRLELAELEGKFLAIPGGLDAPERQALWPRLAELNAGLGHEDAGVCWVHALWADDAPVRKWAWQWLQAEVRVAVSREAAGTGRATPWVKAAAGPPRELDGADLDALLALPEPTTAEVRALAAYLLWAADAAAPSVVRRLNAMRHFLEAHERKLPARAAWLAWCAVAALSGGDVLALARARDRLLERLFQNGLRPEQDLPAFLRCGGPAGSQRFRDMGGWLARLGGLANRWAERMNETRKFQIGDRSKTGACLDLIFAYGLTRLGEEEEAEKLVERAGRALAGGHKVHAFLFQAYRHRIQQAREGKPLAGPLPAALLAYQVELRNDPGEQYHYNRVRQHSRILEPGQRIDSYRHWTSQGDPLEQELSRLPAILDRKELLARVHKLLRDHAGPAEARARVLAAAIEQSPRLGEEIALGLLQQACPACDALPPLSEDADLRRRADLLEKALLVAAHFDRREYIQALVEHFQALVQSQRDNPTAPAFDSLVGSCLRGLRKLGMRQEIELLLRQMADVLLQGQRLDALDVEALERRPEALRALLHVAAGWYYFGEEKEAEAVLRAARKVLLGGPLPDGTHPGGRVKLACAYAATLGQAPPEVAQRRFEELFQRLESIASGWHTPGFCIFQMEVVEAVVLAIASDDFGQGAETRRWLDDDEFLLRKRVHHDLRALMARAEKG
ncbi:MAG TPA: hypothetical protein VFA26_04995 [Gemmataceae bacterium]|nr:hypothetical protein [Gemmataceae bacterium]